MDIYNFQLNDIFHQNARLYTTRPVKAMKYRKGVENGWMVYFTDRETKREKMGTHEGIRFFPTEQNALDYIREDNRQYIKADGRLTATAVKYDAPVPVLYRKDKDAVNKDGMHFCFGENTFISDQSCDYEFHILENGCWIIEDMGNIRVWYPDAEETFFGKGKEIVYEKVADKDGYIKVAV